LELTNHFLKKTGLFCKKPNQTLHLSRVRKSFWSYLIAKSVAKVGPLNKKRKKDGFFYPQVAKKTVCGLLAPLGPPKNQKNRRQFSQAAVF
jgi:hypothetical protein